MFFSKSSTRHRQEEGPPQRLLRLTAPGPRRDELLLDGVLEKTKGLVDQAAKMDGFDPQQHEESNEFVMDFQTCFAMT